MGDDRELAEALRELARAMRETTEENTRAVAKLDKTVTRFVVVCERLLASNDQRSERAREAVSKLHPEMDRIRHEVSKKMRAR